MTHQDYADIIKSAALSSAKSAMLSYFAKKIPFLTTKFMNPITTYLVDVFLKILIRETEFAVFFMYIDLRTSFQAKRFEKSAMEYENAKKSNDQAKIKEYESRLINDFRLLAKYNT